MSKPIAEVNGKKVFSDKGVSSINGTKITFTDGSWCDVATGQVVNKGKGYINIGAPQSEGKKITIGPASYKAENLKVSSIVADLDVEVYVGNTIEVTVKGPEDEANAIVVIQNGSTVEIKSKDDGAGKGKVNGITITQKGGRSVTLIGSIIEASNQKNELKVSAKVPKGTSVSVSDVSGKSQIGNTEGNLTVSTSSGDVKAGRVANANLSVMGKSDVSVADVNGTLAINIMGSGDVNVHKGEVSNLTVSVMGSGDAGFGGNAENASLQVMGSGDINVHFVTNKPMTNVMGSGDINVGNW